MLVRFGCKLSFTPHSSSRLLLLAASLRQSTTAHQLTRLRPGAKVLVPTESRIGNARLESKDKAVRARSKRWKSSRFEV